jgi:hypothetical protein
LSLHQYGFRSGRSTCDAVTKFIEDCYLSLENKKQCASRFFDLTKAFDTINHKTLLKKLSFYGCDDLTCKLLSSYLENRRQAVFFNGDYSNFSKIEYGVPQGSVLGPLLFIIYINDLPFNIDDAKVNSYLFADDLALSFMSSCENDINYLKVKKTDIINEWCSANGLSINKSKTQDIIFSLKPGHELTTTTFLGVAINSNLNWDTHVDTLSKKMSRGIFMLRRLNGRVSTEVLKSIYYAHIHSHLSYCTIVWGHHSSASQIFILQKLAVRILSRAIFNEHCKPHFIKQDIPTVYAVYILQCLVFVKNNISAGKTINHCERHNYETRTCSQLINKFCKFNKPYESFYGSSIKYFNFLPVDVQNLPNQLFKTTLKRLLIKNCLYSIEDFFSINF